MSTAPKEDPKLTELRKKYPTLIEVTSAGQLFAFRPAELEEWEECQAKHAKGDTPGPVNREFCMRTLVYPEGEAGLAALEQLFRRGPALSRNISNELADLAEADAVITVKKG